MRKDADPLIPVNRDLLRHLVKRRETTAWYLAATLWATGYEVNDATIGYLLSGKQIRCRLSLLKALGGVLKCPWESLIAERRSGHERRSRMP